MMKAVTVISASSPAASRRPRPRPSAEAGRAPQSGRRLGGHRRRGRGRARRRPDPHRRRRRRRSRLPTTRRPRKRPPPSSRRRPDAATHAERHAHRRLGGASAGTARSPSSRATSGSGRRLGTDDFQRTTQAGPRSSRARRGVPRGASDARVRRVPHGQRVRALSEAADAVARASSRRLRQGGSSSSSRRRSCAVRRWRSGRPRTLPVDRLLDRVRGRRRRVPTTRATTATATRARVSSAEPWTDEHDGPGRSQRLRRPAQDVLLRQMRDIELRWGSRCRIYEASTRRSLHRPTD